MPNSSMSTAITSSLAQAITLLIAVNLSLLDLQRPERWANASKSRKVGFKAPRKFFMPLHIFKDTRARIGLVMRKMLSKLLVDINRLSK